LELVYYIVVGLIVGVLARLFLPGSDPIGFIGTVLVGILGAIAGGYAQRQLTGNTEGPEWIGAIIAAMVILYIFRRFGFGRRRRFI
jgi:uncharacterized membrane protein YeaQ/YmgE (transglycosylase-associated protein family)